MWLVMTKLKTLDHTIHSFNQAHLNEGTFHNKQGKANRVMKINLNFLTFQIFVLPKILNFY